MLSRFHSVQPLIKKQLPVINLYRTMSSEDKKKPYQYYESFSSSSFYSKDPKDEGKSVKISESTHKSSDSRTGQEETTVTRKIGDKEHHISTSRTKEGAEQKTTEFKNLKEDELDEFEKKWSDMAPKNLPQASGHLFDHPLLSGDNLFKNMWKGFPRFPSLLGGEEPVKPEIDSHTLRMIDEHQNPAHMSKEELENVCKALPHVHGVPHWWRRYVREERARRDTKQIKEK